jgi:hypothetical protein
MAGWGWAFVGCAAIVGACGLWLFFADAIFLQRVLSALANCF